MIALTTLTYACRLLGLLPTQTWGDIDPSQVFDHEERSSEIMRHRTKPPLLPRDETRRDRNIVSRLTGPLFFVGNSPACPRLLSQASISCNLSCELWMTTGKIYVDASQPAILRHLGGTFACPTLGAAMIAWDDLPGRRVIIRVRSSGNTPACDLGHKRMRDFVTMLTGVHRPHS
jgi:hypothetical protein